MSWTEFVDDIEYVYGREPRRLLEVSHALDGLGIAPSELELQRVLGWSPNQIAQARQGLIHGLLVSLRDPTAEQPALLSRLLAQLMADHLQIA